VNEQKDNQRKTGRNKTGQSGPQPGDSDNEYVYMRVWDDSKAGDAKSTPFVPEPQAHEADTSVNDVRETARKRRRG
jgi:hypothetical protein